MCVSELCFLAKSELDVPFLDAPRAPGLCSRARGRLSAGDFGRASLHCHEVLYSFAEKVLLLSPNLDIGQAAPKGRSSVVDALHSATLKGQI